MPRYIEAPEPGTIGERLYDLRVEAGLSAKDLAKELICRPASIRDWENNKHTPALSIIVQYAKFFGVTTDWILIGEKG